MKCPCEGCITLAICRHKTYTRLFRDCILLREYDPKYNITSKRSVANHLLIQNTIKPTIWKYERKKKRYYVFGSYQQTPVDALFHYAESKGDEL
jgi:hypothetical protein